jgi:hypothetical protein
MTKKKLALATALPVAGVALFAVLLVLTAATIGRPLLTHIESGNSSAINEAARLVLLIRAVLWPAILILLAVVTSRSDAAGVGLLLTAVVGAILAGYPSPLFTCLLGVVYVAWAWGSRQISRRLRRSGTNP